MSPDQLTTLKSWRLAYVATVYSKWPEGVDDAFVQACRVTAALMKSGVRCFSPIAHSHPVALHGGIDELDHDFWMDVDRPFMEAASGLIVVRMPGWRESVGVLAEIDYFTRAGKPVEFVEWTE